MQKQKWPEFTKILSLVTKLSEVNFRLWNYDQEERIEMGSLSSIDGKIAQAKEWTDACPDLIQIMFLDTAVLTRDFWRSDAVWELWGPHRPFTAIWSHNVM
jgi:hypothetical protein